jgi:adenylate cyclase
MPAWPNLHRQFSELRRRRVFRTAAAYLVAGWLLLQVADVTFEPLGLPGWSQRALILAVAAGLVPVCVLAWIYDIRAGRIVRTSNLPAEAFIPPVAAPAAPAASNKDAPSSNIASIAILPFADLSQARDQDWFCDGLAEEIIDALSCVRGLRVASRTASFRFRDGSVDPREIGRLLSVDAILEGSVRKADERLKITAQLVDAHDGYHLWSESFERGIEDVFAIQGEIARNVAQSLKLSLKGSQAGRFQRHAPRSMEAYEYYLRGRQLAGQTTEVAWRRAPQMFRRAIELDPGYAQAHAGLADALAQQVLWRYLKPGDVLAEATAAAGTALELAPDLAEAHVAQGNLLSMAGDPAGSAAAFERAVALNPGLHEAWYYYARRCFAQGEFTRAAELFRAAYRTRPDEYVVLALAANALDASGQPDEALVVSRQALAGLQRQIELDPDNARLHYMAAGVLQRLGRAGEGRTHVETALRLRSDDFATLYNAACYYSQDGDSGCALDLLEKAVALGGGYPEWIAQDTDLAPLRELPRFKALLASMQD